MCIIKNMVVDIPTERICFKKVKKINYQVNIILKTMLLIYLLAPASAKELMSKDYKIHYYKKTIIYKNQFRHIVYASYLL